MLVMNMKHPAPMFHLNSLEDASDESSTVSLVACANPIVVCVYEFQDVQA
eukprot:m.47621 g.47621  ORF g.47621 m.47621 type:complete len:50 (+) comp13237_c1_seq2:1243-1392(+)